MADVHKKTYLGPVPLHHIDPGNRFRKDYGDLKGLAETFELVGVINSINVRPHPNTDAGFKYELVAGGRRYFAAIERGDTEIEAILYDDIDEESLRLIERIENIQRKPLDWQEEVKLDAEIHRIQQEKYGRPAERARTDLTGKVGWDLRDTGTMIQKSLGAVSENLKIAKALEDTPELAGCATISQARSMVRAIERTKKGEQIVKDRALLEASSSRAKLLEPCYVIGDALEGLKSLKDGCVDLLEIDPPYGIELNEKADRKAVTTDYVEVADEDYGNFLKVLAEESFRVAKKDAWCIFWHSPSRTASLRSALTTAGWKVPTMPLIWYKIIPGWMAGSGYVLAGSHEQALYAHKGAAPMLVPSRGDVFAYPSIRPQNRIHPAEKPLDLMKELLRTFVAPGSFVVSPFLGSGVTLYAAYESGMSGLGWDLSEGNKGLFLAKCEYWLGFYNERDLPE